MSTTRRNLSPDAVPETGIHGHHSRPTMRHPLKASQAGVSPDGRFRATFPGVLFAPGTLAAQASAEPGHFRDLNLDQVVASILGEDRHGLRPLFWTPLPTESAVRYRQGVFRDLERDAVAAVVRQFASACERACERLSAAEELPHRTLRDLRVLDAAQDYCDAVAGFAEGLSREELRSAALAELRDYVLAYAASPAFRDLRSQANELHQVIPEARFSLLVQGPRVTVRQFDPGTDYGTEVTATFARFDEGGEGDHRVAFRGELWMGHIQEFILERVARLYPNLFASASAFRTRHMGFPDPVLAGFAHDIHFYLIVLEHVGFLRDAGLPFCHPEFADESAPVAVRDAFDLALAGKLVKEERPLVGNDFHLEGPERVIVVTGPNQGGKTTFARMFGQLHYLASLGLPVPGTEARLRLPDRVFTHFQREEDATTLRGGLEDDLVRMRGILEEATSRSVVVINELFASTTLDDARLLGSRLIGEIVHRGALCVYVTFVDELASLGEATVSMVATVDPEDPARRTFRIVRAPAAGRAYADAIARKYRLSPAQLKERLTR